MFAHWRVDMTQLAERPNVAVELGGIGNHGAGDYRTIWKAFKHSRDPARSPRALRSSRAPRLAFCVEFPALLPHHASMTKPKAASRKAGRPRKSSPGDELAPLLSTELVVDCAYELCDSVRLENLTLDQVARKLNVSTTTVRHHIKTRAALTTALIQRYNHDLRSRLPALNGRWDRDLDNYLRAQIAINLHKPGFASYFFEHRFSPALDPFKNDDTRDVSTRLLAILKSAGLNTVNAALAWNMIQHLIQSIGYSASRGQTPENQAAIFEEIGIADDSDQPDRVVLAALRQVNLPMIYDVTSSMLKHAIAVKFNFVEKLPTPSAPDRPRTARA